MDIGKLDQSALGNLYFGGWQLVEEKIVTGSPLTSYTFSGLNGDVDEEYRLVTRHIGGDAGSFAFIDLNGDTGANYGYQFMQGKNTTLTAERAVANHIYTQYYSHALSEIGMSDTIIHAKSGYVRTAIVKFCQEIATTTVETVGTIGCSWNNTIDNITSIVINGYITNGLGVGTHLLLFKRTLTGVVATSGIETGELNVKGNINCGVMQKIYENTLSSAAQSINITGLNGDIDTIYELNIRDVIGANGTAPLISPNGDTNGSNYGGQRIRWQNTTISATRQVGNGGFYLIGYGSGSTGNLWICKGLIFAKSGYLRTGIFESYCDINGTTIDNGFFRGEVWTNTADNITSLLIDSQVANGFGVGAHFELWALRKKI